MTGSDHDDWTEHRLTDDESHRFEVEGYLTVPGALTEATVAELSAIADRELDAFRSSDGVGPHHVLNLHDCVGRDPVYLDLIDWPVTFPKVFGILGWHIQLYHTQFIVSPPTHPAARAGAYGWHQDNNRMNRDFETVGPHPRVSLKVAYFLSDLPDDGMGNFCIVPGSHLNLAAQRIGADGRPDGAIEVKAGAGDALVFDRRLWHSGSTNLSQVTRKALFYGYSYRWLRPKSCMDHSELWPSVDPIRRQLLGWSSSQNGFFDPTDDDVPLRTWIREHLGAEAVAP